MMVKLIARAGRGVSKWELGDGGWELGNSCPTPHLPTPISWLVFAFCVSLLSGCVDRSLDTDYGRRAGESIAGTTVLGKMFDAAGHRVTSWRALSPRLDEADTIVWAPDRFEPPSSEVIAWLDDWLDGSPERELIYIGRDFSPAIAYWRQVLPGAPADQAGEIRKRLTTARTVFRIRRQPLASPQTSDWFTVDGSKKPRTVSKLSGPWSAEVDASQARIKLHGRLTPAEGALVLLTSERDPLVSVQQREWAESGRLFVVANGSFLLNLPLVNHEHRKLAGKLVSEIGQPGDVVFLESGPDSPPIRDEDPSEETPTGMEVFSIWPLNFILLHLALLGVIFAFARAPIFGIPRRLASPPLSDFARHVAALGDLLQKTQDRAYAIEQLRHYHHTVREGKSKHV